MSTMKGAILLTLLVVKVQLSQCCDIVDQILFCPTIPIVSEFPPNMLTLVMSLNNVGEISSTAFLSENLVSVTTVRIRNAGVTGIAEGAFNSFQSLTSLTLDQNLLTEINPKWLGRPAILTELSLSENNISVLSGAMLHGFTTLNKLNLARNRIRTINPHTFSNLTLLDELDLSDNNLTQLTSEMFSLLHSTNVTLHGNPWDCSCDTRDFTEFIKDLQSRSLLLHSEKVTCASPPSLRGQPVWNVSVCNTSTLPSPPRDTETSGQPTTTLTTTKHRTVSRPTPDKKTTLDLKTMLTLDTTIVSPQPPSYTPNIVPMLITVIATIVSPQPPSYTPNIVPMLITVIVVLCVALLLVIVLAVLYRRKRNRKVVAPGGQKEQVTEAKARHGQKTNLTAHMRWDTETPCQTSFTGVRAKSANAILFTSPFGVSSEDHVAPSEDKQDEVEESGGNTAEMIKNKSNYVITEAGKAESMLDTPPPVNDENVPYLSIGSQQNEPNQNNSPTNVKGQRSKVGRGMHRISTWPPTAVQWQERCKRQSEKKEEEEEEDEDRGDGLTLWTQTEGFKMPGDAIKSEYLAYNYEQTHEESQEEIAQIQNDLKRDETQTREDLELSDMLDQATSSSSMSDKTDPLFSVSIAEAPGQSHNLKFKGNTIKKVKASKDKTQKTSAMGSSQRGEGRRSGSKAPSGGASPSDETLLDGNEYVVQDLLHEVVQSQGRWTRERWRQTHMNKQRQGQQGQR